MITPRTLTALGCALALSLSVATPGAHADPPAAAPATGDVTGTVNAEVAKHKANTVVFVKNAGQGASTGKVTMDQRGLVFDPRVMPIQKGTTVEFLNSDSVGHNVFTPDNEKYDLGTWPQGQVKSYQFVNAGVYRQLCRVHDDMIAFIVVLDTKFFGKSDKAGAFKIPALPPGKYTLGVWHEKLAAADVEVEVVAGKPTAVAIQLGPKK